MTDDPWTIGGSCIDGLKFGCMQHDGVNATPYENLNLEICFLPGASITTLACFKDSFSIGPPITRSLSLQNRPILLKTLVRRWGTCLTTNFYFS